MLWVLNYARMTPLEQTIQAQNKEIFAPLRSLAESDHFSKIKMSFNEKCKRATEKCSLASCAVPQMEIQDKDGVIDLLRIRESYSSSSQGSARVWMDIYDAVKDDDLMKRVVSGLHFSVTTHLSAFHTKMFSVYFSNPLIFQRRFKQEYKDNFLFLYSVVRAAVANLERNKGDVPQRVRKFSRMLRRSMMRERRARESKILSEDGISEHKPSLAIGNRNDIDDVENDVDSQIVEGESSIVLDLPKVDRNAVETVNEIVRCIACLGCQKCRLWGTIQTKGLKAAIKSLNGMPLYKNDVIFLINVFRRLSVSVEESMRLQRVRFPHLSLIVICHKQITVVTITLLSALLTYQRVKRSRKIKCE